MREKKCKDNGCAKKTSIGGQALIEGIMMRGPAISAMAVRNPEGEIVLEKWENKQPKHPRLYKLPVVRGIFNFVASMRAGYKALMRSAEISGLEELEEEAAKAKKEKKTKKAKKAAKENADAEPEQITAEAANGEKEEKSSSFLMNAIMVVSVVFGVALALLLFTLLPAYLYKWCAAVIPFLSHENPALNSLIKSAFEGLLRIAILVAYMSLVTLMKDIRRTFQYHGAEHKTIFCYEHGLPLTVENVRRERRFHPRCGTSFLILMLIVSIFISFFIDPLFLLIMGSVPHVLVRSLVKILLLPLIMGIGYELIKLAGRHDNLFTRIISAPGMWLQHITVLEPTDDMIECAIAAFSEVIPEDKSDSY